MILAFRWQVSLFYSSGPFYAVAETDLTHTEAIAYVVTYNEVMGGKYSACVTPWTGGESAAMVRKAVAA